MDNEKKVDVQGLIEKGKSQGSLSNNDIMEAVEFSGYDVDQIEKIYEVLENSGIEVTNYLENDDGYSVSADAAPEVDENEDIDKLLADEGVAVDDPVRMYLKDIGKIPLLDPEREAYLAEKIADGGEFEKPLNRNRSRIIVLQHHQKPESLERAPPFRLPENGLEADLVNLENFRDRCEKPVQLTPTRWWPAAWG